MLRDDASVRIQADNDFLLDIIAEGRKSETLRPGIYQMYHFGHSHFLEDSYDGYPTELSIECYGVCDSVENLLMKCPELAALADRRFIVTLTPIRKAEQSPTDGWRWHKWGPYIGNQKPQTEYIYDEPEIEEVFVYHIYEWKYTSGYRNL